VYEYHITIIQNGIEYDTSAIRSRSSIPEPSLRIAAVTPRIPTAPATPSTVVDSDSAVSAAAAGSSTRSAGIHAPYAPDSAFGTTTVGTKMTSAQNGSERRYNQSCRSPLGPSASSSERSLPSRSPAEDGSVSSASGGVSEFVDIRRM